MSTLKKILSLTLALAMLMSVSVFADFADKDEIDESCVEAVNLLTSVNILNGFEEDGTFRPTATITRAQAAKMIYVLCNKGVDDKAANWAKGPFTFPDVTINDWFAGYVEYCAIYGYVEGYEDGTFKPQKEVTGIELAKMLLTVAGYKSSVQGYAGANWAKAVVADATTNGIFAGCNFGLNGAAPRQWAAKMFKNTFSVKVPMYIGDYLISGEMVDAKTVAQKFLDMREPVKGVVVANNEFAIDNGAKTAKNTEIRLDNGNVYVSANAFPADLLGKKVEVTCKGESNNIFGYVVTGSCLEGAVKVSKSSDNKYTVKMGETTLKNLSAVTDNTKVVCDSSFLVGPNVAINTSGAVTIADLYSAQQAKTNTVSVYAYDINSDKVVDYLYATEIVYGEVSGYSKTDKSFTAAGIPVTKKNLTDGVVVVNGEVKDGTIVAMVKDYKSGKTTVSLVESVVGLLAGVNNDGTEFTVNGKKYVYSAAAIENSYLNKDVIGEKVEVYFEAGTNYIVCAEKYVENTGNTGDSVAAQLTDKLAMVLDANKVVIPGTGSFDEMGRPVEGEDTVIYFVKVLLTNGKKVTFQYDAKSTKTDIIKAADLVVADGENFKVADKYAFGIFQYEEVGSNIVLKKRLEKTTNVKYFDADGEKADVVTAENNIGLTLKYNGTKKLFEKDGATQAIMGNDNTLVFAIYHYTDAENKAQVEYKLVKLSELDKKNVTVIAATADSIATVLVAKAEYSEAAPTVQEAEAVVLVTGAPEYRLESDNKTVSAYFQAIDLKNGAKAVEMKLDLALFNDVESGKKYVIKTEDGVVTEVTADDANWEEMTVTAKAGDLIIIGDELYETAGSANNFKNVKVIVKTGSAYKAGTMADVKVAAKATVANLLVKMASETQFGYIIVDSAK